MKSSHNDSQSELQYDHRSVEQRWRFDKVQGKQLVYDHKSIETKWQRTWEETKLDVMEIVASQRPFYNLMMFPYPSAEGLHVGNMYAFTGSDIYGRFKRMQGYKVFEPIGLDGFGIHSENYALKVGRHPMDHASITQKNFYRQLGAIGCMYDWSRTVETYDPSYYKWTQWLFVQMFKHGLAYRGKAQVNFCPSCKTVLADEQVIKKRSAEVGAHFAAHPSPRKDSGQAKSVYPELLSEGLESVHLPALAERGEIDVCERCGNTVIKKLLEQWFFRITAYAEKLLENSFTLDWSEKVRVAQQQWIGKKEGVIIHHKVEGTTMSIDTFSAYPAWLFADTFIVIAPDHPQVEELVRGISQEEEVTKFVESFRKNRKIGKKQDEKEGVFTGRFAQDPFNPGARMPIWLANFALMDFGTGIIRCSAHDVRDYEFAQKYKIKLKEVIDREDPNLPVNAHDNEGVLKDSGPFTGKKISPQVIKDIVNWIEKQSIGKAQSTFHLRDWLISRQRYWGPPIPMIFCEHCAKEGKSWFAVQNTQKTQAIRSLEDLTVRKSDSPIIRHAEFSESSEMRGWYPVDEKDLPVVLPRIDDYKPGDDGVAPLAKHKEFYETTCPGCGGKAVRETDVSDTFLDSSWYFLRYPSVGIAEADVAEVASSNSRVLRSSPPVSGSAPSAKNSNLPKLPATELSLETRNSKLEIPWDRQVTRRWLPVNMYTGGAEHSVLHLMYSRFVTMALKDWGYIEFDEPFSTFYAHGLVIKDGAKMSKSKGNVVNPDEYIERYGADALRLYLMFTGPYDQGGDFRDSAMEGMSRWMGRVWRMAIASMTNDKLPMTNEDVKRSLNKLVKKVGEDIEKRRYNTSIASMMEFTNLVADHGGVLDSDSLKTFLLVLAPFAPYMAEELWQRIQSSVLSSQLSASPELQRSESEVGQPVNRSTGQQNSENRQQKTDNWSVHLQPWPSYDESALVEETVTIVVQVNGKLRDTLEASTDIAQTQKEIETLSKRSERVAKHLAGKTVKKVIFVPGKLINFVIG